MWLHYHGSGSSCTDLSDFLLKDFKNTEIECLVVIHYVIMGKYLSSKILKIILILIMCTVTVNSGPMQSCGVVDSSASPGNLPGQPVRIPVEECTYWKKCI